MKWERTEDSYPLDKVYELFTNAIKANVPLNFMTSFKHDNITYIASPLNIDDYPNEILNTNEQKFYLWKFDK